MSVIGILKGAKFPKTTVDLCLRQDLSEEVNELIAEQARIARSLNEEDDKRLGRPPVPVADQGRAREIEEEIQRLEDEMAENVLTFHFCGISTTEYGVIQRTAGKPRKDNRIDQATGYNIQAFFEKAIKRCCYKVTAPDGSDEVFADEHWKELLESITDAQFDLLCAAIDKVNRKTDPVPTKARSSEQVSDSEQSPEQPIDLASVISDSSDGSLENTPQS